MVHAEDLGNQREKIQSRHLKLRIINIVILTYPNTQILSYTHPYTHYCTPYVLFCKQLYPLWKYTMGIFHVHQYAFTAGFS